MCERTIHPYGAIAKRAGKATLIVGFSLVWDKEMANWFVLQANLNGMAQYGHWAVIPLPGYIEVSK